MFCISQALSCIRALFWSCRDNLFSQGEGKEVTSLRLHSSMCRNSFLRARSGAGNKTSLHAKQATINSRNGFTSFTISAWQVATPQSPVCRERCGFRGSVFTPAETSYTALTVRALCVLQIANNSWKIRISVR